MDRPNQNERYFANLLKNSNLIHIRQRKVNGNIEVSYRGDAALTVRKDNESNFVEYQLFFNKNNSGQNDADAAASHSPCPGTTTTGDISPDDIKKEEEYSERGANALHSPCRATTVSGDISPDEIKKEEEYFHSTPALHSPCPGTTASGDLSPDEIKKEEVYFHNDVPALHSPCRGTTAADDVSPDEIKKEEEYFTTSSCVSATIMSPEDIKKEEE